MNEIILRIIIAGIITGILFIIPDKDSNEKYDILEQNKMILKVKEDTNKNYFNKFEESNDESSDVLIIEDDN